MLTISASDVAAVGFATATLSLMLPSGAVVCAAMRVVPTRLDGPVLFEPAVHPDDRGFFCETYRKEWHAAAGIPEHEEFVQDNH
ncbi:MAG TPA: dTDP-4-dehydrorhamnose 3,5-epimerase family protein, partial [Thermoanaerobaculia bacterium]|nr:dTDP-4-dehydrorhamnose 3,5-epimerase family protein [Thermoanaerobaculia bacterium]